MEDNREFDEATGYLIFSRTASRTEVRGVTEDAFPSYVDVSEVWYRYNCIVRECLQEALKFLASKDDDEYEYSRKARSFLGNFDKYMDSYSVEQCWNGLKLREERDKTRTDQLILEEKKDASVIRNGDDERRSVKDPVMFFSTTRRIPKEKQEPRSKRTRGKVSSDKGIIDPSIETSEVPSPEDATTSYEITPSTSHCAEEPKKESD
ncbi:13135_t:CDS:2 [Funneliformis geosporum]|uniref:13135_t:CDS:1 n=1 Tax=Funneliformis geosporum TaxID=1117311 RepID=A0A9W4X1C2_9GLOM|nr:13135_t:CDS:2 [Funneliformis geosporum]